jgi:lysozyme family protein
MAAIYTSAFSSAVSHSMLYEVGPLWNEQDPETISGAIVTPEQRRKCGYNITTGDTGGETKYGIAKNSHPDVNIKRLNWEQAKNIYYQEYWVAGSCDKLPPKVAVAHFDACVNLGVKRAIKLLQHAVGVEDDGIFGPMTRDAVMQFGQNTLCNNLIIGRKVFYQNIIENNPSQQKFWRGWTARADNLQTYIQDNSSNIC